MLSRAARAVSRRAFTTTTNARLAEAAAPAAAATEAPKGAHGEFSEFSPSGIDRTNPLHAPSPFESWKEAGYSNIAAADWKHWEGVEDEHLKHFAVNVDPADVEDRGAFWNLFSNYKTAIPAAIVIGFPLIGQGHIHMDWHVEAAAIFWTTIYGISAAAKDGMYSAISSDSEAKKRDIKASEAAFEAALRSSMLAHERAIALPSVMDKLNDAVAALHEREAAAATIKVKVDHREKMVAMLDYLVTTNAAAEEGSDLVVTATLDAVEAKLASDKAFASAVLDEAIDALVSGQATGAALADEFTATLAKFEANPPVDPTADPEAEAAKARTLFLKRFGFNNEAVTEDMLAAAKKSPSAHAYLTARCGGVEPAVGTPIAERAPIDY
ncbi:hypothetical protein FNF29_07170 [Cafeteria roenbergensis]|uniref:Uncharacterized protein n=1 Tax=Cafeteria roenbergensis TaxID=33653 RepID=A0A5A8CJY7_CAFRO|nr:hypothetical protein FNF28_07753 [Cafeteria roenbergensis]KAA0147716.1 hypothetical protein FNF29_07170 [Cafeteria roenbergensis]KAA0152121.1 hypothetical protein FNF31_06695 [Cafeteria roenbergensis]|eukprot:KAA0147716.1 hypothetical protein FNF29_07170 [Cafeteria roenbergensis]